jgi:hypothetical protein
LGESVGTRKDKLDIRATHGKNATLDTRSWRLCKTFGRRVGVVFVFIFLEDLVRVVGMVDTSLMMRLVGEYRSLDRISSHIREDVFAHVWQ